MRRRLGLVLVVTGAVVAVVGVVGLATDLGSTSADEGTAHDTAAASPTTAKRAVASEDPSTFFDLFMAAVRSGDTTTLTGRLHPAVVARYGTAQCATAVASLADPAVALRLVGVDGPGQYDYASDGLSTPVPDAFVFHVDGTGAGRSGPRDYHFALVDGQFHLFIDCGTPVASQ